MRLTFISRSDLRGGAAIVTYRLVEALRKEGIDARMLVCEKMSDSDFVEVCAPRFRIEAAFLSERLEVFMKNGADRATLFKIDPASQGLPLWCHPWVREADAVILGWVNQGMLSLKGVDRLASMGKPLIWMMHDMWNMTGICHHAGECSRFEGECGCCPLLGRKGAPEDMSHKVWTRKKKVYDASDITFVAVSSWLAGRASESSLLRDHDVEIIHNPFSLPDADAPSLIAPGSKTGIIFGAARLDDPIKGLPVLRESLRILRDRYPEVADDVRLLTFGGVKDPDNLSGFAVEHVYLGVLKGADAVRSAYEKCRIVVSTSDFETLPGTLVEGQAYGCIPVAFDHGGQRDIVDHMQSGWLADWNPSQSVRAESIAEGIRWAYSHRNDVSLLDRMRKSVGERFESSEVARKVIALVNRKIGLPWMGGKKIRNR